MKTTILAILVSFLLVSCASTQPGAPSAGSAASTRSSVAPVDFGSAIIENSTGIAMRVTVEAPVGTIVVGPLDVAPGATVTLSPGVSNVSSALIRADFGSDHGTYSETVTVTGSPVDMYIEALRAVARIGEVTATNLKGSHPRPN